MNLLLAWRQLTLDRRRFAVAIVGVAFAVMLMLMQLGFRSAMLESSVRYHDRLPYDLVLLSPRTVFVGLTYPFPRRRLVQALALPEVTGVSPVYTAQQHWKNPWTHQSRNILVVGMDPVGPSLDAPGVEAGRRWLTRDDDLLFDTRSRPEYGPVGEWFERHGRLQAEIANRRITVAGLYELGSSFGIDGNVLTSDLNFLRIFPNRSAGAIDLGLLDLVPGADVEAVRDALEAYLEDDVLVLTRAEWREREFGYWAGTTPIGFVFGFGLLMGLVVGGIIVYQILFADVADHLAEYATLKAVGYSDRALAGIVVMEALMLAALGFLPGVALTGLAYGAASDAIRMPVQLEPVRVVAVFGLTVSMCALAALVALRKLREADPADVF